ncbi:Antirestriction protein ArdC [Pseudarcicella hirudinis]|uniref:Antirestriction protein ArdC n=1 Tax=Pseudarcicella hirudinis TaxID=1079859 RepID=A0A1I5N0C5_9BACT|nr:zincin-like metallopeptidase domain-containing protein [Pseudarcicella hirudinis]SFP15169.1 Antirestriction protein ArdC [Pseudarcicella hirudinis]
MEYYGIESYSATQVKKLGLDNKSGLGKIVSTGTKNSIYDIITDRIIEIIQNNDNLVWRQSWTTNKEGQPNFPMNYTSKENYKGFNGYFIKWQMVALKHDCPYFMTYKQVFEKGGNVKKGAKAYTACFYTKDLYRHLQTGKTITASKYKELSHAEKANYHQSFTLKVYNIFNANDIEGVKFDDRWKGVAVSKKDQITNCEKIYTKMPNKPKLYFGGDKAYYTPNFDSVQMPVIKDFNVPQEYYSTLFHELIHSTGYSERLNRKFGKGMSDPQYAFEELIAELGASYLCGYTHIDYFTLNNSAAYIKSWKKSVIEELRGNNKAIFKAASEAQKASDYILGKLDKEIYRKFKGKIETPKIGDKSRPVLSKSFKLREEKEKLKGDISKLTRKVKDNAKFKEKLAFELDKYLKSLNGLSGLDSELTSLKAKKKFLTNLLRGDNEDFKVIGRRVGLSYRTTSIRKK